MAMSPALTPIKIGIVGAGGRMGQALVREALITKNCRLIGGIEHAGAPALGRDLGSCAGIDALGITIDDDAITLFLEADVVIDFSTPDAAMAFAPLAADHKAAYVVGTTGLDTRHLGALSEAGRQAAVVQAYNMSLGVNLLAALVEKVAAALDADFDIEIVEMHHRAKIDAPSGTALLLGDAAARGRGVQLPAVALRGRDGVTGPRPRGGIGFAALRGGNVAGDHTVIFAGDDERIELTHKAGDRVIFARGAIRAAIWAAAQKPGLYSMADVLGLKP
jgi:4-hydroxy-tetrahydrodipicolinate reductase